MRAVAILLAAAVGSTLAVSAAATPPGANGRIAFSRVVGESSSLYVVDANGQNERRITRVKAPVRDTQPDWSADGSRIVFERDTGQNLETWTVRPDGSGLRRIDPGCPEGVTKDEICEQNSPAVSPDGRKVAYANPHGDLKQIGGEEWIEVGAIAVMNADGSGMRQLTQLSTPTSSEDLHPFWSPNGKRIGFVRLNSTARPQGKQAIFVMNADGTGVRRVTPWSLGAGDHPDWSPDGRWILFRAHEQDGFAGADLYRVHPDGTGLRQLTSFAPEVEVLSASFAPDGSSIVFSRTGKGGLPDLFVMRSDGKEIRQLTKTARWDSAPDWGPAG
jgi:Tol biopolymer transport system component